MKSRVEVICVGTELLNGHINTHATQIGQKLSAIGLSIAREHTVGDDPALMRETFAEAYHRSDLVICAGGLGPTFDDITREVWSKVLGRPLIPNTQVIKEIEKKFSERGLRMPPMNRRQAMVLKGASALPNPNGTAPGQFLDTGRKVLVLFPGPARELHPMLEQDVIPKLRDIFSKNHLAQKSFLMFGTPESRIDEIIRPWVSRNQSVDGCAVTHGILASQSIITVKFSVQGPQKPKVETVSRKLSLQLRRLVKDFSFGEDNDTMESVVGRKLVEKNQTMAVAESCTGGLVSKLITDQPGSSEYFIEGVTCYANSSKMKRLGVKSTTLDKYGAVSAQTAREMAEGLKVSSGATHALSITGIAGPTGAMPNKPVGLVYIGYAGPKATKVKEFHFNGDRAWVRHRASLMALDILRRQLV